MIEIDQKALEFFEPNFMDSVCDYIQETAPPNPKGRRSELAQMLLKHVHAPIDRYLKALLGSDQRTIAVEFGATESFRDCVENVAKLLSLAEGDNLYDRSSAMELAEDLRGAWKEFIVRRSSWYLLAEQERRREERKTNRKNATGVDRRPGLSSKKIEEYLEDYVFRKGSAWGFWTKAAIHFQTTAKTLKSKASLATLKRIEDLRSQLPES